jgi:hypothetical protein
MLGARNLCLARLAWGMLCNCKGEGSFFAGTVLLANQCQLFGEELDRRVRLARLARLMKIRPQGSFAGMASTMFSCPSAAFPVAEQAAPGDSV